MNNESFESIKAKVLPYFVAEYGEENRELVSSQIDRIAPFFIETSQSFENKIRLQKNIKKVELTIEFLEQNGIEIPENVRMKVIRELSTSPLENIPGSSALLQSCFGGNSFIYNPATSVRDVLNYDEKKSYLLPRIVEVLEYLGINVTAEEFPSWFTSKDAEPVLEKMRHLSDCMTMLEREYTDFESTLFSYTSQSEKLKETANALKEEYYVRYLESLSGYMTPEERELLNKYRSKQISLHTLLNSCKLTQCVGHTITSDNAFQSFTKESASRLHSDETSEYLKDCIRSERIKYYKMIGVYDGTPKEEFLKSDIAKNCAPSLEVVDDIISKKKDYLTQADDEIAKKTSSYEEDRKKYDGLDLCDPTSFGVDLYKNKKTACILPSARLENGVIVPIPILCYTMGNCLAGYRDVVLIHEIAHAVELTFRGKNKKGDYCYKSGFEFLGSTDEMTDSDSKTTSRKYEQFSETINQLIAIEITEMMHADGVYLLDDPRIAKTREGTVYEQNDLIVAPFWQEFKKPILNARLAKSMDELFNTVGRDNFERLNEIVREFSAMPYVKLMTSIQNGEQSPLVDRFKKIYNESISLITAMKNYSIESNEKGSV